MQENNLQIFKEEIGELLEQQEALLLNADKQKSLSKEDIRQLFRIVHTIKGTSDMFGLKEVTKLNHLLESVLDEAKDEKVIIDAEIIDLFLRVKDVTAKLTDNFFKSVPVSDELRDQVEKLGIELKVIIDPNENLAEKNSFKTGLSESQTTPENAESYTKKYHITFTPDTSIFHSGGDPALIISELKEAGECTVKANSDKVPLLHELSPEDCYLSWDIYLNTNLDYAHIEDIFVFFSKDEYVIREIDDLSGETSEKINTEEKEQNFTVSDEQECGQKPDAKEEYAEEDFPDVSDVEPIRDEELINEFILESREHLETIEDDFMALEESADNPDPELVNKVFRAIHSMKGSAGFLNLTNISRLAHSMETLLSMIRSGEIKPENKYIQVLLQGVDRLNIMLDNIYESNKCDIRDLLKQLNSLIKGISSNISSSMDTTVNVKNENAEDFHIDELTYNTLHSKGQYIYILDYKIRKVEKEHKKTLKEIIGELVLLGNIIDVKVEYPDITLNDKPEDTDIHVKVLFSTVLEPDLIRDAVFLPQENIKQVKESDITKTSKESEKHLQSSGHKEKSEKIPEVSAKVENKDARIEKIVSGSRKNAILESVRVPSERLDTLVNLIGEMVITQARISAALAEKNIPQIESAVEEMEMLTSELRDNVLTIRMMPIGTIMSRFKRLVRDLSMELKKQINFEIEGAETELDKTVLDKLGDPLVHLLRNSIDHGIEAPEDRKKAGKPPAGTIKFSAYHKGANVIIVIHDDGKGLDTDAIRAKAIEKDLISEDSSLSESEIFNLIFEPGFSTAKKVSNISGRGVGMDVVKKQIETLRGSVEITSERGKGTTITLSLPLTLAIIDGLLVKINKNKYIVPLMTVKESVKITKEERLRHNERNLINLRGIQVPYIRLRELFNEYENEKNEEYVLIIEHEEKLIGVVVDEILGTHQTVIKSLGKLYKDIEIISGATILGDGEVALIFDIAGIIKSHEKTIKNHKNTQ